MIHLDGVSKRYHGKGGTVDALVDVSVHVKPADVFGIVGFSGAGKSTLIRMVNQLELPDSGTIMVDGHAMHDRQGASLRESRRNIGMVFQQFNLLETKSVYRNVAMPLILAGRSKAEISRRVDEVLRIVELEDKRNMNVRQLSGGQKQRVGIARALATEPKILLCDEATSALDPKTTESILALLQRINREMGVTILLITHQMHVIQRVCNKVAVMDSGRIVEQGSVLEVFGNPREDITREFVRTVINDAIPESMMALVREERRNFRLERLRFIGEAVRQPVISKVSRIEGLELNVLGATVEELEDTAVSIFQVQLIGPDVLIDEAEALIDAAGVQRERVMLP